MSGPRLEGHGVGRLGACRPTVSPRRSPWALGVGGGVGGTAAPAARERVHSRLLMGKGNGFLFWGEGKAREAATNFGSMH